MHHLFLSISILFISATDRDYGG